MNPSRLDTLFDAWSESRLTPAEATELSALLRTDPTARAAFRAAAELHGQLHAAIDGLNLDQATAPSKVIAFPASRRALGLVATFLALGLTVASFGWLLAARTGQTVARPLGIHDGGFDTLRGQIPSGFPAKTFTWGGDPSEVSMVSATHPTAVRFLEAGGEPNVPHSPHQSCDIFQIIDLRSIQAELLGSSEAFVELQASFHDARAHKGATVRFISKIYVFEGNPADIAAQWPPQQDKILGSGAQFYVSQGGSPVSWKTLSTRCVLPPTASFLVIQIGAGSGTVPAQASPQLGAHYVDDIRLTLKTRHSQAELAAR